MYLVYDYMTACFMFQQNLMILIVLEITANLIINNKGCSVSVYMITHKNVQQ